LALVTGPASLEMLLLRASIRSTTFSPRGRGFPRWFAVALRIDEFGERVFVVILELLRLEVRGILIDDKRRIIAVLCVTLEPDSKTKLARSILDSRVRSLRIPLFPRARQGPSRAGSRQPSKRSCTL
jgi:hypothetical protein